MAPRTPEGGAGGQPTSADPLAAVAGALVALAEGEPRREVCGLVVARPAGGPLEVWPLPNAAPDPARAYEMAPADLLAAMARLDREGAHLAAVYHSHPAGGADLSAADLAVALAGGEPALPGVAQLVVALAAGRAVRVRVHRFRGGRYQAADLWPELAPGR